MSILWFIIKTILLIILGIFLVVLALIGTILLAPIKYEAYFSKYDQMSYDIKVKYLGGIRAIFFCQEHEKKHSVSLFSKVIYEDSSEQVRETDEGLDADSEKVNRVEKSRDEEDKEIPKQRDTQKQCIKTEVKTTSLVKEISEDGANKKRKKIRPNNLHHMKEEIHETKEEVKGRKTDNIKENLTNPLTYRALKEVIKGVWDVLKLISPDEWDFELVVGTGEPADTGELIAKLTMFYPIYYQHGIIRGDYEKSCLMGGFLIKGRFNLLCILIRVIKLYFEEDVNTFIHLIKKKR